MRPQGFEERIAHGQKLKQLGNECLGKSGASQFLFFFCGGGFVCYGLLCFFCLEQQKGGDVLVTFF